ncbi:2,3-epoxybenzoyl-CoA dihydrolase [Alteraurantiacibacter buctensis]|uniref:Benzoyl-CoA-dihydrodiol lyase n=1 Tax=Alteraurantiacibacter buctensis TaxID=1503981 RepID=A0A844Z0Y4_9SPHN|nr:2,3-epoxybenzoyl-CoA dihydrolase [Alteraurantiacibacter buctensis]MXO73008.1 benzoyl-CoA-dihydrodiol lyase [Alteraurantiacibacter buctensis]
MATQLAEKAAQDAAIFTYDRTGGDYRHWKVAIDGRIATVSMDVDPEGGLLPGYKLKLNSYDLGVDMELHDIVQRLRFEHPQVACVVLTSANERIFCSGANIYMLGISSHAWKVNFCKFTNETRNGFEDSSQNGSLKFLAAVNGTCAGGGYEVALACDEILLIDDRSSAVSLPEVPLLAVLPGTGGLTRVVDKRKVRRDLADVFCTSEEGVRGRRAKDWNLVDDIAPRGRWDEAVRAKAEALAAGSARPQAGAGVHLDPLKRVIDEAGYHYGTVDVTFDRARGLATVTVKAPDTAPPADAAAMLAEGTGFWPLQMARELDDAILMLRTNEPELGLWVLKTTGDGAKVLAYDAALLAAKDHWFANEVIGMLRRTLSRLDVSSRSIYAVIEPGSAFAGTLAELAFAADRGYMLELISDPENGPVLHLGEANFGHFPMCNGLTRLGSRFLGNLERIDELRALAGSPIPSGEAHDLGLVTFAPDDIDWEDEVRLAIDERAGLSPDACTGMEASLRFAGAENVWSKVFGRLSAWQNWIFIRPNAVGDGGALKLFGSGRRAEFDRKRV